MDRLFDLPRLYRNMDHPSYRPDETQFDPELTAEGSQITSPDPDVVEEDKGREKEKEKKIKKGKGKNKGVDPEVAEESAHEEEQATPQKGKGKGQKQQRIPVSFPTSDNEEEEGKRHSSDDRKMQEKGKKKQSTASEEEANDSPTSTSAASRSRSSSIAGADPASPPDPSQLRHLVVDHILESKSHLDFLHSLPEQHGPLLVRFPTTTFSKGWKKRYFTLHGDGLYFHEDQSFIHPNQGRGSGMGSGGRGGGGGGAAWTGGVNYDKCKKIDIAKFTVIQQAVNPADTGSISASAAFPAATPGEKVYGGGQPIPSHSDRHESSLDLRGMSSKPPSKFDEMFKNKGHTTMKDKPEGHVVRGRRRSSVVLDKGCMIILLMPTDKKTDPVELTGLNEGGIADMPVLNEWVHALNARICLLSYLNSPLHLHSLGRGGREVLAFLTDPSATVLRIAHKFTELAPVLAHFKEPLSQRSGPVSFIFNHCAFTDDAMLALCDILLANPQLEVDLLSLSGNLLTARSMGALHRTLRTNLHIKQLILDQNQLGDAGLDVLLHGEAHTSAAAKGEEEGEKSPCVWSEDMELHTVSLKQNQLSDRGLEAFLHSILEASSDVPMEEDKAKKGEEEAEEASTPSSSVPSASSSSSFSLSSLDFSCNQITDLGVQVLSGFLQRHPRVQQLNLSSCFVTDEGVAALTEALGAEGSTLRSLNLSHNQITSAGMSRLIDALTTQTHKGQMELELSGNTGIGAEGLQKLLSLRVPAKEGETDSSLWPVKLNSLSFTLFDESIMPTAVATASTQSTAASTSSLTPAAPAPVQNVLNLFSPAEDASQLPPLPNFHSATPVDASQTPLPTEHESPAKVVPAPQSAHVAGSPASATLSPSSPALPLSPAPPSASASLPPSASASRSKQLGAKGRRPSFNDPSAPRISISNVDRQRPTGKLTIPQLQPPPQFMPPTPSPEPEPDHTQTEGAEEKQEAITQPAAAAHADEEEDDPNKQELIPTPPGWRKPPGVAI